MQHFLNACMQEDKRNLNNIVVFIAVLLFIIVYTDYLFRFNYLNGNANIFSIAIFKIFIKFQPRMIVLRLFYLFGIAAMPILSPAINFKSSNGKALLYFISLSLSLVFSLLFILGYSDQFILYDRIVFPAIGLVLIPLYAKSVSGLGGFNFVEKNILGISKLKANALSFSLIVLIDYKRILNNDGGQKLIPVKTEEMILHNPTEGIWIEGGAGSGKSAFLFNNIIRQVATKHYAGVIYDFEGDPTEKGSPVLTKVAYNCLKTFNSPVHFKFINFTDMSRTFRCNPIDPKYMKSNADIMEIANCLMLNLNKDWIKNTDFWGKSAISVVTAGILRLKKGKPEHCTIPHLICYLLSDHNRLFKWLLQDKEVGKFMRPTTTAFEQEAGNQLSGVLGSVQLPLTAMLIPELFWVLSKDEVNLDITSKEHPSLLCLGNCPKLSTALGPALSIILSVIKQQMNQMNRQKGVFMCDELPTIFIKDLENLPATARKKGVATILGVQLFSQMEEMYGEKKAEIIRGNCGTVFIGRTPNEKTGQYMSRMLGQVKRRDISLSTSETSKSQSESMRNEDVLQQRDIQGQDTGQFTGKIAGGKPPYFSLQFDMFDFSIMKEDIPAFSFPVQTQDENLNRQILNNMVQDNYLRIQKEVEEELEVYA